MKSSLEPFAQRLCIETFLQLQAGTQK